VRLAAQAEGLDVKPDTHKEDEQSGTVTDAVKAYLDNIQEAIAVGNRRPRTFTNAKHILAEFQQLSKKKYLKEVTRQVLFEYVAWASMRRLVVVKFFPSLAGFCFALFIHSRCFYPHSGEPHRLGAFWCPMTMNGAAI
jgi:hypothetical protein